MLMGNNETAQGEDDDLCAMATTDDELKKKSAEKKRNDERERKRRSRAHLPSTANADKKIRNNTEFRIKEFFQR